MVLFVVRSDILPDYFENFHHLVDHACPHSHIVARLDDAHGHLQQHVLIFGIGVQVAEHCLATLAHPEIGGAQVREQRLIKQLEVVHDKWKHSVEQVVQIVECRQLDLGIRVVD